MSGPAFLTEPPPPRGVAVTVADGVRRLVADNPGPMTYHGTNTYLIDGAAGPLVLDPGPDDARHLAAILACAGAPVAAILLSHGHADHAGSLPALRAATGAPVFRWDGRDGVGDGMTVAGMTALHTPGHARDHLCFARGDLVFSGDHVMSFASSVVIPPDGDMADYMAGLRRLAARAERRFLPGHGPPIDDPRPFTRALLAHRERREADIAHAITSTERSPAELVEALYPALEAGLRRAAQASVLAHLLKLAAEGRAACRQDRWHSP